MKEAGWMLMSEVEVKCAFATCNIKVKHAQQRQRHTESFFFYLLAVKPSVPLGEECGAVRGPNKTRETSGADQASVIKQRVP